MHESFHFSMNIRTASCGRPGPLNFCAGPTGRAVQVARAAWCAFMLMGLGRSPAAAAPWGLTLSWTNNLLTIASPDLPGGKLEVLYLEAFCQTKAHDQDWHKTTLPHKTQLVSASKDGRQLRLLTRVQPEVEVSHEVRADRDEVEFVFRLTNRGKERVDLDWLQPACIRVDRFTGLGQSNYIERSFIFTERGLTMMSQTRRTTEALYKGGQVYVPPEIPLEDANPRPISLDRPVNGLIGCVSADQRWLLATAWDRTHELFQGVYVCLHADPHVGGLAPAETKRVRGKLYFLKNDPKLLLKRYERDFGK